MGMASMARLTPVDGQATSELRSELDRCRLPMSLLLPAMMCEPAEQRLELQDRLLHLWLCQIEGAGQSAGLRRVRGDQRDHAAVV